MAATLTYDGAGRLSGALGVSVQNILYDVSFADGDCDQVYGQIYGQCSDATVFQFTTLSGAVEAGSELHQQVFAIAGSVTVVGCGASYCQAWIPYEINQMQEHGVSAIQSGGAGTYSVSVQFDSTMQTSITRTIWAPSIDPESAVNVPAMPAAAMLLAACALCRIANRAATRALRSRERMNGHQ